MTSSALSPATWELKPSLRPHGAVPEQERDVLKALQAELVAALGYR